MTRIVKAPDERRSELIAMAQHLFYTKGYECTSVSDIVEAVGVAQGTFYYYFDSKTAVLEAVVAELNAQERAFLQEIAADEKLTAISKWNSCSTLTSTMIRSLSLGARSWLHKQPLSVSSAQHQAPCR